MTSTQVFWMLFWTEKLIKLRALFSFIFPFNLEVFPTSGGPWWRKKRKKRKRFETEIRAMLLEIRLNRDFFHSKLPQTQGGERERRKKVVAKWNSLDKGKNRFFGKCNWTLLFPYARNEHVAMTAGRHEWDGSGQFNAEKRVATAGKNNRSSGTKGWKMVLFNR